MTENRNSDRVAGIVLMSAAAASMFAMAHHPTSLRAGAVIQIVHGAMILFVGMMAFGIATVANAGAATVNGFAAPALAAHGASHEAFDTLWFVNQALAGLGVAAGGMAYALWALALWRRHKLAASLGLLAGPVPALLLLGGWIDMHLHWAILVYAAQALWAALAGWLLFSGRLDPQADPD